MQSKIAFKKNNKISYDEPYVICDFDLGVAKIYGPDSNKMSYYNFTVKKEHHFIRNIFTEEELKSSGNMDTIDNYYQTLQNFMWISTNLVTKKCSSETEIESLDDRVIEQFLVDGGFESFEELLLSISLHE